jgi:tellurite resistance protein TerC
MTTLQLDLFPSSIALSASTATGTMAKSSVNWVASEHFPVMTVSIFAAIFAFSLVMDLIQHRDHKDVSIRNAAGWSVFWVALSLGFWGWLRFYHGNPATPDLYHPEWSSLFLTGYVLEKTLSVDNLMVFIAVFRYFGIRSGLQHRILYYGVLGAIGFRAVFVALGSTLLTVLGPYAEILFGVFVLWAGIQMLRSGGDDAEANEKDYDNMPLVRFAKRIYPVFPRLVGVKFFVDAHEAEAIAKTDSSLQFAAGVKRWMTPAFVCLLVVEGSDVMFSVDSVPAVIAVSKEPMIVYTAMIFAVLGLRSLYFIVEALTHYLHRLETAVIGVLFFIGVKMLVGAASHWGLLVPWWSTLNEATQANYSLFLVLAMLLAGVVGSVIWPQVPEPIARGDGSAGGN